MSTVASVQWIGHHQPIYCFGDESVLAFDNLACEDLQSGAVYTCRAEVIPGQSAGRALDESGTALSREILTALADQNVVHVIYENGAFELLWNIAQHAGNFVAGSGQRVMPILLFRLGNVDCRELRATGVSVDAVEQAIAPYVRALTLLKERGFAMTFVCSIATQGDAVNAKRFNAVLAERMHDAGVVFLDTLGSSDEEAPHRAIELLYERLPIEAAG